MTNTAKQDSVLIFDTTLRDGEQSPGATMSHNEKLEIAQMLDEICRLQPRLGVTTNYVTHDQGEAMTLADRIVVMNDGKI